MTVPALVADPQLRLLQAEVAYPSVTLLMPTVPASHLARGDQRTLARMAAAAVVRLADELEPTELATITARRSPTPSAPLGAAGTDLGLAVLVSPRRCESIALPFAPRARVIVDPTFATRDLVAARSARPRYRTLVLSAARFRLPRRTGSPFGRPDAARVAPGRPRLAPSRARTAPRAGGRFRRDRRRRGRPEAWRSRDRAAAAVVTEAEAGLDVLQRRRRLPIVLVGDPRVIRRFAAATAHRADIVGSVAGTHIHDRPARLALLAAAHIDAWVAARHAAIVSQLDAAGRSGRLQWGLADAWAAALAGQVERLWVADDYAPAARPAGGGTRLTLTADRHAPDVIDDTVDDLIEIVELMGGTAHQVPTAALPSEQEPVAVLLRSRRHHGRPPPRTSSHS